MSSITTITSIDQLIPFLNKEGFIEIATRGKHKRFKAFQKIAIEGLGQKEEQKKVVQKVMKSLNLNQHINVNNMQLLSNITQLSQLSLLLNGLNLCATCVGFAIVCQKLDSMEEQLSEILSVVKTTTDLRLEQEFTNCIQEHNRMLDHRKTKDYFSLNEMESLVMKEYSTLDTLLSHYTKNVIGDKGTLIYSIMMVASMLSVSLRYYDEMYFFEYKDRKDLKDLWHTSHATWLKVFDRISASEFIKSIQDYGFLELNLSTSGCDAFYISVRDGALDYKQDIIDNQELLMMLETEEKFNLYHEYCNEEVKKSIYEELAQDETLAQDESIKKLFEESMLSVGIIH